MTRRYIVRHGIAYAVGTIIANVVGAFVWPTSGTDLIIRMLIALFGTAGMTALLCHWTSPQERPPDVDEPLNKP